METKKYNFEGFAMQYADGSLAAVDYSSGGYPYPADNIQEAWIKKDRKQVEDYLATGNLGLSLVSIKITVEIK